MSFSVLHKVIPKGVEISGDLKSGYRATVPYLLAWGDAGVFVDELMGGTSSATVGPITWRLPHRYPGIIAAIYAQRFRIQPCGADGALPMTHQGLAPGEYFTHAIVTAEYGSPEQAQFATGDDPQGRQQLDPANPITLCEQSVRTAAKMETLKGGSYIYDDDSKPVPGDFAVPFTETKLVLKFPRVPYLPWQLIRPYQNKLNSVAMFGCSIGTLRLEDMDTTIQIDTDGPKQAIQLAFAVTHRDDVSWNHLPKPDGTNVLVRYKADSGSGTPRRIYEYADFRAIFNHLTFVQES